jgi:hypothetical protein
MKFMIEKPTDCLYSKMLNCTESQVSFPSVFTERSAKASVAFLLDDLVGIIFCFCRGKNFQLVDEEGGASAGGIPREGEVAFEK